MALLAACASPTVPYSDVPRPTSVETFADQIVFTRLCCGYHGTYVVAPSGGDATLVFPFDGSPQAAHYAISPNGRLVAMRISNYQWDQIRIVDTSGAIARPFPGDTTRSFAEPSWSPDGARIAFEEGDDPTIAGIADSTRHVLVGNADGTGVIVVGDSGIMRSAIAWSHDGQRIIYSRRGRLVTVNADGSSDAPQPIGGVDSASDPAISPDGTRIVLTRGPDSAFFSHIYVVGADGSGLIQLTATTARDFSPSWSPDGRRIIFTRVPPWLGGLSDISYLALVDADGSHYERLSPPLHPIYDIAPAWGPAKR